MKFHSWALARVMLFIIFFSVMLNLSAIPRGLGLETQLKVLAPTAPINVPTKFGVDINVTAVTDLCGWQIKLYYNPTVLRWINATLPPGHVFDGKDPFPFGPINETDPGTDDTYILYCVSIPGGKESFNGNGILCRIYFEAQTAGTSLLNFSRPYDEWTYLWNSDLNPIPAELVDSSVTTQGADPRAPTEISIFLDKDFLVIGDRLAISGTINVTVPDGTPVHIEYRDLEYPAWRPLETVDTTDSNYTYIWEPSETGFFGVHALWDGDETNYKGATSETKTVTVEAPEAQLKIQPKDLVINSPTPLPTLPFMLNVTLLNVTDLYRWTIKLIYDPVILEAINVTIPPDNVFGENFVLQEPVINATEGIIIASANSTATTGFNGSGVLCRMAFRSINYSIIKQYVYFANTYLRFDRIATELRDSEEKIIFFNYEEDYDCRIEIYSPAKRTSYITLEGVAAQVKIGTSVTFKGGVTPTGVGLPVNVTLRYRSQTIPEQILAINETDDDGRFTFSWNATTLGIYYFNVSWAGNEVYNSASATKTVRVVEEVVSEAGPPDMTLYIVIAAVVVIVALGVVVYLKKFRGS